jgi:hypothetical protein
VAKAGDNSLLLATQQSYSSRIADILGGTGHPSSDYVPITACVPYRQVPVKFRSGVGIRDMVAHQLFWLRPGPRDIRQGFSQEWTQLCPNTTLDA